MTNHPSQCSDTVGWVIGPVKHRLRNDLNYVEWEVKSCSTSGVKTITRSLAAERTALVAGGAAHLLQAGRSDEKRQHRRISVDTSWHAVAFGRCDLWLFRFSMCPSDGLTWQTILQLCCTPHHSTVFLLQSSTVKLTVFKSRLKNHLFNTAAYS